MIKQLIYKIIFKIIFNYEKPFYNNSLYDFSCKYIDFYCGENNADMNTNGESRFINKLFLTRHPKIVFDVGANIGNYTQKLIRADSAVEIYCFEPTLSVFEQLNKKFHQKNVHINNFALGDRNGKLHFYENAINHSFNSFYKIDVNRKHRSKAYMVQTVKLDTYCKTMKIDHIDFMKIDTEGDELNVLKGAGNMLSRHAIDIIQFEFGYAAVFARNFLRDFFEFFNRLGYEIYKVKTLKIEKIEYNVSLERCSYANFLAIRKGIDKL